MRGASASTQSLETGRPFPLQSGPVRPFFCRQTIHSQTHSRPFHRRCWNGAEKCILHSKPPYHAPTAETFSRRLSSPTIHEFGKTSHLMLLGWVNRRTSHLSSS